MPSFPAELLHLLHRAWTERDWDQLYLLFQSCELNEVLPPGLTTADFIDHLLQHWPQQLMSDRWRALIMLYPDWPDRSQAEASKLWRCIERASTTFAEREAELAGQLLAQECVRVGSINPITTVAGSAIHNAQVTVAEAIRWLARDHHESQLRSEAIRLQSCL